MEEGILEITKVPYIKSLEIRSPVFFSFTVLSYLVTRASSKVSEVKQKPINKFRNILRNTLIFLSEVIN